jgi:FkbM family methyltransferase
MNHMTAPARFGVPLPPDAKLIRGLALPQSERHFVEQIEVKSKARGDDGRRNGLVDGRGHYQLHKIRKFLTEIVPAKPRRRCIDVGAQVGLWAMHLVKLYGVVECFEPVPLHLACFRYNMAGVANAPLHGVALGAAAGRVTMVMPETVTGHAHVLDGVTNVAERAGARVDADMVTLDSFGFADVDLIKIDVEGTERQVLEGGAETLARCRPWVIVEQKCNDAEVYGRQRHTAARFLEQLGWTLADNYSGDRLMRPPK